MSEHDTLPIFRKLKAIHDTYLEAGLGATITHAVDKALRFAGIGRAHCYLFVSQSVDKPVDARLVSKKLTWRELSASELLLTAVDEEKVARYLGHGAIAVGVFRGDQRVGILWYVVSEYKEDEVRATYVPLPHGCVAWDFGVEIDPRFRLGRAFVTLWAAALKSMGTRGLTHTVSRINAVNAASVRSHRRFGASPIGYAYFYWIGRWQLSISNHTPKVYLSFNDAMSPKYRIDAEVAVR